MSNANARVPEGRQGCNRQTAAAWIADYLEATDDDEFQEDSIHQALNEGVLDYPTAYRLRMGEVL